MLAVSAPAILRCTPSRRHPARVRRRPRSTATLDDVVELLRGIGTILMEIDEKLARILGTDGEDEDEGEPDT